MLVQTVESYLKVRRACGFELKSQGNLLRSFAIYSETKENTTFAPKLQSSGLDWHALSTSVPAD